MSDPTGSNGIKPGRFDGRITFGNLITIAFGTVALAVAWGALQSDIKALAQRVGDGERRDEKSADKVDEVKGAIIELRTDAKATRAELERQGRQLDRIEGLLRGTTSMPPQPFQRNP